MQEIEIGHIYQHFKGNKYIVLDIVNNAETEHGEPIRKTVIYQALYDERLKWARPLESFASEVDHKKYPKISQKWRFEKID